jgi:hypothetical protein
MTKEQLIIFIKQAKGIKDEGPVHHDKKKKKPKAMVILSKPDIKAKIREIKKAKAVAHENKEETRVALLRRRISRLKKLSRKIA